MGPQRNALTNVEPRHLLVVEDDEDLRALIGKYLVDHGFKVALAEDGKEMAKVLASEKIDLIVLDVNLPGEDGFSICLRLRNAGKPPVVMVTSRGEDMERILGIELGADDYLVKPFIPRELLARISEVLRRSMPEQEADETIQKYLFAGFILDVLARRLFDAAAIAILTSAEFEILLTLPKARSSVLARSAQVRCDDRSQRRYYDQQTSTEDRKGPPQPYHDPDGALCGICIYHESDRPMKIWMPRRINMQIALLLLVCVALFHAAATAVLLFSSAGPVDPRNALATTAVTALAALNSASASERSESWRP